MTEQKMFKITVKGYGWTGKNKSNGKPYLLRTLLENQINLLKSDQRFHPIGVAIAKMEFPEQIEIVLGLFSSNPLFIKVGRIGDLYFLQPDNEKNEGFLMFGGNAKIPMWKNAKEIHAEFFEQLLIFLKRASSDEFAKGIEFNKVSQWHLSRSKVVGDKLLFLREGMVTFLK